MPEFLQGWSVFEPARFRPGDPPLGVDPSTKEISGVSKQTDDTKIGWTAGDRRSTLVGKGTQMSCSCFCDLDVTDQEAGEFKSVIAAGGV